MIGFIVQSDSLRSERTNFDTLDATRHPDAGTCTHSITHSKVQAARRPKPDREKHGHMQRRGCTATRRQHKQSHTHKYGGAARCGQSVLLATLASALLRPERDQRQRGRSRRGWSLRGWSRREWSRRARCTPGCGCLSLAHNKHSRMRAVLLASTLLSRPQRDRR